MIKAHPTDPMLRAFAADELPLPLAVGLSAHCELCPDCAARLKTFEEELAQQYLASPAEPELASLDEVGLDAGFDAMLADIRQQLRQDPGAKLGHPVQGDGEQLMADKRVEKASGNGISKLA